jgi:hypothetical protein
LGTRNMTAVGVPVHNLLLSPCTTYCPPHRRSAFTRAVSGDQTYGPDTDTVAAALTPPLVTPILAYFSTSLSMGSSSSSSSPTTPIAQEHLLALLPEPNAPFQHTNPSSNMNGPKAGFSPLLLSSHPSSPTHAAKKQLSFISYPSTATSTLPHSSLIMSALTSEPPPHIPGLGIVSGGIGGRAGQ